MPRRTVYIDDQLVIIRNNWKLDKSINAISTMTCTVTKSNFNITKGMLFDFRIDSNSKFKGIITSISKYEAMPNLLYYDIKISDWTHILKKRLIAHSFSYDLTCGEDVFVNETLILGCVSGDSNTAGYIINWIITNILADDGITAGTIQNGQTFDHVTFNYKSCFDALNYIQEACLGYNWHIDIDKKIHFISKSTYTCNTIIDQSFPHTNFKLNDSMDEYINKVYFEGGKKETSLQTSYVATPKGDGQSKEFTLRYPIAKEPIVLVDTASKSIGINGLTTGKDCYWTYGSNKISFEVPPANGETVYVTYFGLIDIKMLIEDTAKIAEMADIENNSGIYEKIWVDKEVNSNSSAIQFGQGLIDKYNDQTTIDLEVEYDIYDLDINMLVKVEKDLYNLDAWYLIESISAYYSSPSEMKYSIKLIGGEHVGDWESFFKKLLTQQKELSASDVFTKFKNLNETFSYTGIYQITSSKAISGTLLKVSEITCCSETTIIGYAGGYYIYD